MIEKDTLNSQYNSGHLQHPPNNAVGAVSPFDTVTLSAIGAEGWLAVLDELEVLHKIYDEINAFEMTQWRTEIKLEPAPMKFIGTYTDEYTTAKNKVEGLICAPVLAKQDVAPTLQGGLDGLVQDELRLLELVHDFR